MIAEGCIHPLCKSCKLQSCKPKVVRTTFSKGCSFKATCKGCSGYSGCIGCKGCQGWKGCKGRKACKSCTGCKGCKAGWHRLQKLHEQLLHQAASK